jgi:hypothetical protein
MPLKRRLHQLSCNHYASGAGVSIRIIRIISWIIVPGIIGGFFIGDEAGYIISWKVSGSESRGIMA